MFLIEGNLLELSWVELSRAERERELSREGLLAYLPTYLLACLSV